MTEALYLDILSDYMLAKGVAISCSLRGRISILYIGYQNNISFHCRIKRSTTINISKLGRNVFTHQTTVRQC